MDEVWKDHGIGKDCCCEPPTDPGDDPCLCFELPETLRLSYIGRSSDPHPSIVSNGLGAATWVDDWPAVTGTDPDDLPDGTDVNRYFETTMPKTSNFVWEYTHTDPVFTFSSLPFKVTCVAGPTARAIKLFLFDDQIVKGVTNWIGAFEARPLFMFSPPDGAFVTERLDRNYLPTHGQPAENDCNDDAYKNKVCCPPIVKFKLQMSGRVYIFYTLYDSHTSIDGWRIRLIATRNVGMTLWPGWNAVEDLIDVHSTVQSPTMDIEIHLKCSGKITLVMSQTQNYHGGAAPGPACPNGCRLGYASVIGQRSYELGQLPCTIDTPPVLQFPTWRIAPQLPEHHSPTGIASLTFEFVS